MKKKMLKVVKIASEMKLGIASS